MVHNYIAQDVCSDFHFLDRKCAKKIHRIKYTLVKNALL